MPRFKFKAELCRAGIEDTPELPADTIQRYRLVCPVRDSRLPQIREVIVEFMPVRCRQTVFRQTAHLAVVIVGPDAVRRRLARSF